MSFGASRLPVRGSLRLASHGRQPSPHEDTIQPFGALLVVRQPGLDILRASANAAFLLGGGQDLVGCSLDRLDGDLAERIRPHLTMPPGGPPLALRARIGVEDREYTALLHRPLSGGLVIELEPAGPGLDFSSRLHSAMQSIITATTLTHLCDRVARLFKDLTDYERVLVFRFDEEGGGEVFAEQREADIASCLGKSVAEADIPCQSHALIMRNRIRLLVDAAAPPVPIWPRSPPAPGDRLDLSRCVCRSLSPFYLRFLRRLGVRGALITALLVGGRPWGLVVCHHRRPHFVCYELRAVCELLAEAIATRIAALEGMLQSQAERRVRGLEQRLVEAISRDGDWAPSLFDDPPSLLRPLEASGAVLVYEGKRLATGKVPDVRRLFEIIDWLDAEPLAPVIATASLGRRAPWLADLAEVASGLIAAPLAHGGGEYLIWFRPQSKRDAVSTTGSRVSGPRERWPFAHLSMAGVGAGRGLAQAHGRSAPWTSADRVTARLFGASVADVIQQFRSVRVLIAQAQLAQARSRVNLSDQLILIADADGRILLTTQAWDRCLGSRAQPLESLRDFVGLCGEPILAGHGITELLRRRQPWHGQVSLCVDAMRSRRFMVRADPVFASPERVLGFVVLLTEVTAHLDPHHAGRRLAEGGRQAWRSRLGGASDGDDSVHGKLLAAVFGNGELAAREVTRGIDAPNASALFHGVEASVARTVDLLEGLLRYAGQGTGSDPEPGD